ncbi:MAG: hypothetical protein FJ138_08640, partial [Deltaproteobacteria bacterium]|nr:hypothetical protein [Deltaproteobacteria bacterium]
MAIQLGVSMCSGGGAALYNTSTRALIALAEEAPGDGARAARRYAGPALPPRAARERPAAQEEGPPLAPKGAIRACLEAAGLSWGDVGAVRVSGPEGAVERLWVELLGLSPERVTAGPSPQLALARYAAALDGAPGDALIIATDPHGPHGEHGDRGARRAYSLYHARAGELHLTHERLLSPHLAPLSCPAQAYLALAERARLTLGAPLGAGELLGWASNLAAEGEELPNLPPWFSARRGALDAEARPYDLWLDVLALERRLERLGAGLGASEGLRRALWASLLRKGQRELAAALGEVARGARASLGVATLTLAGALASDPRLCDLVGAHSAPEGAGGAARAYPGGGAAVAAAAAGLGERRGEREAPLEVPLALAGRRGREGGAREGGARLEAQAAALDVASRLLSVKELEPSELERQFAQLIARGEGVGRYEPSSPLATPLAAPLAAPQATSRALLLSPTCAAARSRLNEELAGRPLHAPLYIICPAERAAQLFDPPPRAPLALAAPRPEHLEALRPALRADGLAQVVAVSPDEDPALVRLCEALWAHFHHPPALLAAPLALRSGQPVDSPA